MLQIPDLEINGTQINQLETGHYTLLGINKDCLVLSYQNFQTPSHVFSLRFKNIDDDKPIEELLQKGNIETIFLEKVNINARNDEFGKEFEGKVKEYECTNIQTDKT